MAQAYYERLDSTRFLPTVHAGGAWRSDEQHFAPVAGLLTHEIERHAAGGGLTVGRLTFEILGVIGAAESEVSVETVRPGRTISLVEATMTVAGRAVVRARAWLLAAQDTSAVAGGAPAPLPPRDQLPVWHGPDTWPGGYIASIEVRRSADAGPGRAQAWLSTPLDLVDGEPAGALARFIGLVDTANGIAVRESPGAWMFPNLDLSVHLYRQPTDGVVGLDTTVVFGPDGVGLTSSVLHDEQGPVGRAEQVLTVRPMPAHG
ncbi:thioesterase family protein [Modestobacter sp. NPDC049651]|uniref:thioesterase family protein n=1 Tax=unclassified Modestobacter TaxID=2643866 RepID=UPI0033E0148E